MSVGLYDLLPLFIRLRDKEASGRGGNDPILKRIVDCFQDEADATYALIAGMRELLSPRTTSDLMLALLANYLGIEFSFTEIEEHPREYVEDLPNLHKIKGTILSIIREMKTRRIGENIIIHELWKTEINAVDEYIVSPEEAGSEDAYKSARVVFIGDVDDGYGYSYEDLVPLWYDKPGEFVYGQVAYSQAKQWRDRLNNVFPIHVLVPVPVRRKALDDEVETTGDELATTVVGTFVDRYMFDHDNLRVAIACVAACQVSCQNRCEVLCELSCETNCESSCQAACEADCQAICQSFCQNSCELQCQDACQDFCQSVCEADCEAACEGDCQQQCQNDCQSASEVCQSFCEMNCQTDAEVHCQDNCQVSCQSPAQVGCVTCASSCEAGSTQSL